MGRGRAADGLFRWIRDAVRSMPAERGLLLAKGRSSFPRPPVPSVFRFEIRPMRRPGAPTLEAPTPALGTRPAALAGTAPRKLASSSRVLSPARWPSAARTEPKGSYGAREARVRATA